MWTAFPRGMGGGCGYAAGHDFQGTAGHGPREYADYGRARAEFSWSQPRTGLDGLPGGGVDIAYEAAGRCAGGTGADAVAPRCVGRGGEVTACGYNDLRWKTGRFGAPIPAGIGARHG